MEPAEGGRGHGLDPAGQGGHVALLHADVELLVIHLLWLGVGHGVSECEVEGETLLTGPGVAVFDNTEVRVVSVSVVHGRDVKLPARNHHQLQV